jgi:hypothetical protein
MSDLLDDPRAEELAVLAVAYTWLAPLAAEVVNERAARLDDEAHKKGLRQVTELVDVFLGSADRMTDEQREKLVEGALRIVRDPMRAAPRGKEARTADERKGDA